MLSPSFNIHCLQMTTHGACMQQAEILRCMQNTGMPLEKVKGEQFCQTPLGWEKTKAGLWAACRNYGHSRWTQQLPQTMQVWNRYLLTRQKTKAKTELSLSFRGQMDCTGGSWTLLPCKALLQASPLELASAKCPWSAACVCSLWKGQEEANVSFQVIHNRSTINSSHQE